MTFSPGDAGVPTAREDTQARFGLEAVAAETEAFHRDVIAGAR